MRDATLIDFNDMLTCLLNKMSASVSQSTQFAALPNPSVEHKPYLPCLWDFPQQCPLK